jgi:lactoylglutathione lyase
VRIDYAIVFVSDMPAATGFFRDVMGLPLRFETPEWTEFATEGSTLALHATDVAALPPTEGSTPAGSCRTGFSVPDLRAFHERMQEHGVACLQEPTELHGTLLAQYTGPDGVVLGVSEMRKPN